MKKLNIRSLRSLLFQQCSLTGSKKALTMGGENPSGRGNPPATAPAPPPPLASPPLEPFRRLLPAALFLLTFITVMTFLLVYMDNTAMRQQQFRLNMSREYEMAGVSQDDASLVAYLREWQVASGSQPFPPHAKHSAPAAPPNREAPQPTPTEVVTGRLFNYKKNGIFVEAGAYGSTSGGSSRTEWLEQALSWRGLLVTPDARDYFRLRALRTAPMTLAAHACLSTSTHPKEITYQENSSREEVGVLALGHSGVDEFSARVKCFPLYSLLLAAHAQNADFLSLSCGGCELAVLASLPKDKVHISVVEIVGKRVSGVESLLMSRGYTVASKTNDSIIYSLHSIPTLKI